MKQAQFPKVFSVLLALIFCLAPALTVGASTYSTGRKADMSGYKGFTDKDHVFEAATADEILKALDDKKTFTLYFGFDTCPWCIEAVPVLNETAKEYKTKVLYNNTRPNRTETSNSQMPDYEKIVNRLGEYFDKDETGKPKLYVPFVLFVRNGQVVKTHEGTVAGHVPSEAPMTAEQRQELQNIYRDGFEKEFRR